MESIKYSIDVSSDAKDTQTFLINLVAKCAIYIYFHIYLLIQIKRSDR